MSLTPTDQSNSKQSNSNAGRWFTIDGHAGIVRYHGPVAGTQGLWLGVEWATPGRGKHHGIKDNHQYFICKQPESTGPHGSFIRSVERIKWGQSLLQATQERYIVNDLKELDTLPQNIDGKRGKIEAVGLDKVAKEQSDLKNLHTLGLDSMRVENVGDKHEIEETRVLLGNVQRLSLANNYLTNWDQVLEILGVLSNVDTLDISANHFDTRFVLPDHTSNVYLDTLRIDSSPQLEWPSVVDIAKHLHARSLSFGWSNLKSPLPVPQDWSTIQELHLESNQITDPSTYLANLPNLRILNLRGNPLTSLNISKESYIFPALHTLNLSNTGIREWSAIDQLNLLPCLQTLSILNTPLTNDSTDIRAQLVSRLPKLTKLDSSYITAKERTEMERYYLVLCSRSIDSTKEPSLLVEQMAIQFPRIKELVEIHGLPASTTKQESRLKSRLASVSFQVVGTKTPKKEQRSVIRTMLVRQLMPIAARLAGTRKLRMQLYNDYQNNNGDETSGVALDNDTRSLSHYGIQDGSVIKIFVNE